MAKNDANTNAPAAPGPAPVIAPAPDPAVARLAAKLQGVKAGKDEHPADVAIRVIEDLARSNKSLLTEIAEFKTGMESFKVELDAVSDRSRVLEKTLADARAQGKAAGPVKTRFMPRSE